MSITNLQKIMRAALFTPTRSGWGLPILFWGPPGIGKSDIIEGVASSHGFPCEVLSPGERGEGAFGVTPMPDSDGYISYPPPRWSAQFAQEEGAAQNPGGLVFLDEINTAPPAIQAAMMGLLLKRRIGGSTLDSRVRMLGAANDVADSAGGWDLAPPIANRLGHIPWEAPSESEWTDWLMSSDDAPQISTPSIQQEKMVMSGWNEAWSRARGIVAGFVRAQPGALHKQPSSGSPEASKAWPSHRSWEFATRAMASARVNGLSESDGDMFAAAFVGSGVMGELITYRAAADLPDPVALLDGKVQWKPDFKRLDRTYAVLGSTTSIMMGDVDCAGSAVKAKKDTKLMKRFDVFVKLLSEVASGAKDLTWAGAKAMSKKGMHDATDESRKVMRQLLPLVEAVGGQ
jgi:hypothetical protein